MVGYIIKFKNDKLKYQTGKRYHCIKYFFKELKDLNKLNFYDYSDIMILKVYYVYSEHLFVRYNLK